MKEKLVSKPKHEWVVAIEAWDGFVDRHSELGYKPGIHSFHNFLRWHKDALVERDAIRFAKHKFWVAHLSQFEIVAFACATDALAKLDESLKAKAPEVLPAFTHRWQQGPSDATIN